MSQNQNKRDPFREVIEYAISQEEEEERFYQDLATRSENKDLMALMLDQAQEEVNHKEALERLLERRAMPGGPKRLPDPDLHLADYLVPGAMDDKSKLGFQDAMILAIKMEQANERLYQDLAQQTPDAEAKALFNFLALQEARHRGILERYYDEEILEED